MGNWPGPTGSYHFQKKTAAFKKDGRRGRDNRTPGPWRPNGTVGSTGPDLPASKGKGFPALPMYNYTNRYML